MPTLCLFRHAKSAWDDPTLDDHDRPLQARGERAAVLMGQFMRQRDIRPDLVLCSSARRAQDTWTLAATRLSGGHALSVERELYLGGDAALLERLRALPRSAGTVVLVAHQPDMQDLALLLVGNGPADDLARLREKFPTAGLAVIDVPGRGWRDLAPGSARLTLFATPKSLV